MKREWALGLLCFLAPFLYFYLMVAHIQLFAIAHGIVLAGALIHGIASK